MILVIWHNYFLVARDIFKFTDGEVTSDIGGCLLVMTIWFFNPSMDVWPFYILHERVKTATEMKL